jgi:hypothetical protein
MRTKFGTKNEKKYLIIINRLRGPSHLFGNPQTTFRYIRTFRKTIVNCSINKTEHANRV